MTVVVREPGSFHGRCEGDRSQRVFINEAQEPFAVDFFGFDFSGGAVAELDRLGF